MRFSVLLPTRNRAELLRFAIESVKRQGYDEWEIVVADNASSDDVQGIVGSFDDPRILLLRSEEFVSVTENWNRALDASTGEYVIMLGDDDALAPDFFRHTLRVIETHERPELIYSGGWLFTYPDVVPDLREGGVAWRSRARFFTGTRAPFFLPPEHAVEAVKASMRLRFAFDFNMQYSTFRRDFADRLRVDGALFHSPFPDFYASCAMLLESRATIVDPRPSVIIGVSPKSYGAYIHDGRADIGRVEFLHTEDISVGHEEDLLPGHPVITNWYQAMVAVSAHYGGNWGLAPDRARYRRLQAFPHLLAALHGIVNMEKLKPLIAALSWRERLVLGGQAAAWTLLLKVPTASAKQQMRAYLHSWLEVAPQEEAPFVRGAHPTILDALDDHRALLVRAVGVADDSTSA